MTWNLAIFRAAALLLATFAALGATSAARAQEADAATSTAALQRSTALSETATTLFLPVATRRDAPARPVPADLGMFVSLNANLTWEMTGGDGATYAVRLDTAYPPTSVVAENLTVPGYDPPEFPMDKRYYWQVIATLPGGKRVPGPIWTFKTEWPVSEPDLSAMVYIPGGEFLMGCDPAHTGEKPCSYDIFHYDEPLRSVWVDSFWMDKYEVTNREYAACESAGICAKPWSTKWYRDPAYALAPVTYVSWWDAQAFCAWESKRLPTEAEWEKAARGNLDTRIYPWGDALPTCAQVNNKVYQRSCKQSAEGVVPVGQYPRGASPFGAHDMAGNVVEWVHDKYDVWYYLFASNDNPQGPPYSRVTRDKGDPHQPYWEDQNGYPVYSIRGGSWDYYTWYLRVFQRHWGHHGDGGASDEPLFRNPRTGFRCAVSR